MVSDMGNWVSLETNRDTQDLKKPPAGKYFGISTVVRRRNLDVALTMGRREEASQTDVSV